MKIHWIYHTKKCDVNKFWSQHGLKRDFSSYCSSSNILQNVRREKDKIKKKEGSPLQEESTNDDDDDYCVCALKYICVISSLQLSSLSYIHHLSIFIPKPFARCFYLNCSYTSISRAAAYLYNPHGVNDSQFCFRSAHNFKRGQKVRGHCDQRVFWPAAKPVHCATAKQSGKFQWTITELLSNLEVFVFWHW